MKRKGYFCEQQKFCCPKGLQTENDDKIAAFEYYQWR